MARSSVKKVKETRHYLKNINGFTSLQGVIDAKNLSVAQVSRLCGISYSTVGSHYYGLVKSLKREFAVKYTTGLGVGMEQLFTEKESL